jgi:hypothetical protein
MGPQSHERPISNEPSEFLSISAVFVPRDSHHPSDKLDTSRNPSSR